MELISIHFLSGKCHVNLTFPAVRYWNTQTLYSDLVPTNFDCSVKKVLLRSKWDTEKNAERNMYSKQSDAMVIIEARPHCSLSIPVSLHGMAQGYAYARHEQSHRAATHKPLHLSPVYITPNTRFLMLFLWIQIKHHPPIFYPLLIWRRGMANGCPTTTTSSMLLFFLLSCLLIRHALCSHHNGRTSGSSPHTNTWVVYFLFPWMRRVPSFF